MRRRAPVRRRSSRTDPSVAWKNPVVAGVAASAVALGGVALANAIGVGELATGALLAYVVYRVVRHGIWPPQAIMEGMQLEHGEPPKRGSKPSV